MSGVEVVRSVEDIAGTWFIGASTLAMWRRRGSPSLNYLPLPDGTLVDAVTWESPRRRVRRTLLGVDTRTGPSADDWRWRGVGWVTRFTPSRWSFVALAPDRSWAVIRFDRTPFTAAGVDLLFRDPVPPSTALAAAKAACAAHPAASGYSARLFSPPR